jgi:hypothetical protein
MVREWRLGSMSHVPDRHSALFAHSNSILCEFDGFALNAAKSNPGIVESK